MMSEKPRFDLVESHVFSLGRNEQNKAHIAPYSKIGFERIKMLRKQREKKGIKRREKKVPVK